MGCVRLLGACPIFRAVQRSVAALGFGEMERGRGFQKNGVGRRKTPAPAKRGPLEGSGALPNELWTAVRGSWARNQKNRSAGADSGRRKSEEGRLLRPQNPGLASV